MARSVGDIDASTPGSDELRHLAETVRGSFKTVEEMAQAFIREAIHQGVFRPGQRLNLDTIAATLDISRMPVRSSLRPLEAEGLVRIHPHRGATVSVLRGEEIAEMYELRTILESYLLEHAMAHLDERVLDELDSIADRLEDEHDLAPGLDLRRQFYQVLYEQAGRPRALQQVNHLRGSVGRYLLLQRVSEHPEHKVFVEYLRRQDLDAAKAWLAGHLAHVSESLQHMVATGEGGAAGPVDPS